MFAELLLNSLNREAGPAVGYTAKQCLRSRFNKNTCQVCLTQCRGEALALHGRTVVFDADRCTGCMTCVAGCPNDAFSTEFAHDALLHSLTNRDRRYPLTISCRSGAAARGKLYIPCFGLLSEPVLASLNCVAEGAVYLDITRCRDCDNGHVLDTLEENIQSIGRKYSGAEGLKIRCREPAAGVRIAPSTQRRQLLGLAGKSIREFGKDAAASFFTSGTGNGEARGPSEKESRHAQRFLLQALAMLPDGADHERALLYSYFYTLEATDDCDLCPLCTGMCPTGALTRRTRGEARRLCFTSALCSGCGLCAAFCRKDALNILPGIDADPGLVQTLA